MIRTSYIQEFSLADQVMGESYYLLLESKDTLDALIKLENTITSKEFFGESVEGELIMLESEKKNIFTRIGELIISTFNSFIEFLKDIGNSIKDTVTGVRKKTSDDGFKNAMRENPELAQEFMKAVLSGNIKAHDVKDMNALIAEAQSITNDLLTGKIDNKTKEEKIDNALKKFAERAKAITAILGVATSAVAVAQGIDWVRHHKEDRADLKDRRNERIEDRKNAISDRERRQRREDEADQRAKDAEERSKIEFGWKQMLNDETKVKLNESLSRTGTQLSQLKTWTDLMSAISKLPSAENKRAHEMLKNINFNIKASVSYDDEFDFFTEGAVSDNITKAIQKVLNFFTDHIGFCTKAAADLKDIEISISEKAKVAKDSNDGTVINQALAGIRKVMGAVTKELNGIKNLANTAKAKLG